MGGGELDQHSLCRKEHDDSGDYGCLSRPLEDAANAGYAAARHGSHCSDRRVRRSGSCAGRSSLCALDRDIHVPVAHPRLACSTELADVIRARLGRRLLSGRIPLPRAGVTYVMSQIAFGDLSLAASLQTISFMRSTIMPHFADRLAKRGYAADLN